VNTILYTKEHEFVHRQECNWIPYQRRGRGGGGADEGRVGERGGGELNAEVGVVELCILTRRHVG
jgi:hypothetical protein